MKRLWLMLIIIVFSITMVGCAGAKNPGTGNEVKPKSSESQQAKGSEQSGVVGQYVGQIDNNSVEIKIDGEPKAFRTDGLNIDLNAFQPNEWVKISYTQNQHGQLIINSIQKVKQ